MLALPYTYLERLPALPTVARGLNPPKPKLATDYVNLARVLLRRFPTQVMSRAVDFLLRTAQNQEPGAVGDLSIWFDSDHRVQHIQILNTPILSRVAPAMFFRASLGR